MSNAQEDAKEKAALRRKIKEIRAKRAKMKGGGIRRDVLAYPERKGYKRRVVNATRDRIEAFKERGWAVVMSDETGGELRAGDPTKPGKATTKVVGTGTEGPITGVLMEIPEAIFNEDKERKQQDISEKEQAWITKQQNKWDYNKSKFG